MSEKGILFGAEMVRALVIDKTKTHTRRIDINLKKINQNPDNWRLVYEELGSFYFEPLDKSCIAQICKPRYQVGDILYIKETWAIGSFSSDFPKRLEILYKTIHDENNDRQWVETDLDTWAKFARNNKWRSSMFMFKWASRPNRYEVLSVNPHRVQTITDEEAKLEGFNNRLEFAAYLEMKNPKTKPWTNNLWCWNYELKPIN